MLLKLFSYECYFVPVVWFYLCYKALGNVGSVSYQLEHSSNKRSGKKEKKAVSPEDFQHGMGWVYFLGACVTKWHALLRPEVKSVYLCTHDVKKPTQKHRATECSTPRTKYQVITVMKEFIMQAAGFCFPSFLSSGTKGFIQGATGAGSHPSISTAPGPPGCPALVPTTCWRQRDSRRVGRAQFISGPFFFSLKKGIVVISNIGPSRYLD